MTTISAVVFLYSPKTTLAAISILQLDEAGAIGSAAAMATLIVVTSGDGHRRLVRHRRLAAAPHAGLASHRRRALSIRRTLPQGARP